jgi:MFS family permease
MSHGTDTRPRASRAPGSALAPLRLPGFRSVWSALLCSQTVIWMNTVGAVTVIAALSDSRALVAFVQTANSLPAILLALLAGAVADIVDRRRLALTLQAWTLIAVSALAALTITEVVTAPLVLVLTFALGAGMAPTFVVYQSLVQDVVPREELPQAIALNSVAVNLARASGPALAGLLIAATSAGALFVIEAALLLVIMTVVFRLRAASADRGDAERLGSALRAGARFVRFSPPVRAVLVRTALFSAFASALWALLPVVAVQALHLGSRGFGLLLGCVGAGALAGAAVLPRVRPRVSVDLLIAGATVGLALGLVALAYIREPLLVAPPLLVSGACWLTVLSSLNTAVQRAAPGWVRARTLATFQLVMQGGLAGGSLAWGVLAETAGERVGLVVAAAGLVAGIAGVRRWKLAAAEDADLSPALSWSEPAAALDPQPTDGPVLVTLEYLIDDADAERFLETMDELGRTRRRDGAYRWNIWQDLGRPGLYLETFVVDSWEEHMRQHGRFTVTDMELEERVKSMHRGDDPPAVHHLLWAPAAARTRGGESPPP